MRVTTAGGGSAGKELERRIPTPPMMVVLCSHDAIRENPEGRA